jgi:enolase-phosphatase E1
MKIKHILTDIEGTTSSIRFVKEVLFPYSKKHLLHFLDTHKENAEVKASIAEASVTLFNETGETSSFELVKATLLQWIDDDRKHPALKHIQGLIWEDGYRNKDFFGHVFSDIPIVFKAWSQGAKQISIYSSGSIQAQKLLFSHTQFGDLTTYLTDYFDTHIGPKKEPESYKKIINKLGVEAEEILFLSDSFDELIAAKAQNISVIELVREERIPSGVFKFAKDFYEVQNLMNEENL